MSTGLSVGVVRTTCRRPPGRSRRRKRPRRAGTASPPYRSRSPPRCGPWRRWCWNVGIEHQGRQHVPKHVIVLPPQWVEDLHIQVVDDVGDPWTRWATRLASRFCRWLPTAPRSVTVPSCADTSSHSLSILVAQPSSSMTASCRSSLVTSSPPGAIACGDLGDNAGRSGWWSNPGDRSLALMRLVASAVRRGVTPP